MKNEVLKLPLLFIQVIFLIIILLFVHECGHAISTIYYGGRFGGFVVQVTELGLGLGAQCDYSPCTLNEQIMIISAGSLTAVIVATTLIIIALKYQKFGLFTGSLIYIHAELLSWTFPTELPRSDLSTLLRILAIDATSIQGQLLIYLLIIEIILFVITLGCIKILTRVKQK